MNHLPGDAGMGYHRFWFGKFEEWGRAFTIRNGDVSKARGRPRRKGNYPATGKRTENTNALPQG